MEVSVNRSPCQGHNIKTEPTLWTRCFWIPCKLYTLQCESPGIGLDDMQIPQTWTHRMHCICCASPHIGSRHAGLACPVQHDETHHARATTDGEGTAAPSLHASVSCRTSGPARRRFARRGAVSLPGMLRLSVRRSCQLFCSAAREALAAIISSARFLSVAGSPAGAGGSGVGSIARG